MGWRYIARRVLTGEILDLDLPVHRDELTWGLRRSGSLRGTISPDIGQLRAPDGQLLIQEWGTELFAEADGQLRWGGIVVRSRFEGPEWKIEAAGVSAYAHAMPYMGEYSRVGVDPIDAAREIWRHLQSYPNGNLGVVLDGTTSPIRLGKPGIPSYQEAFIGGKWVRKDSVPASAIEPSAEAKLKDNIDEKASSLTLAALGAYGQLTPPYLVTVGAETMRVTGRSGTKLTGLQRGYGTSAATTHRSGTLVKHQGTQLRTVAAVPPEPYLLAWWEAKDCGREFAALAAETPFDWAEDVAWGPGDTIVHRIRIGYPRLGRRRDDLAFVQGDNVISVVPVQRDGDIYANELLGLGAGEGRTLVHTRLPVIDGRLRRVAVYSDKSCTSGSRLDMLCRDELVRRQGLTEITEIEVIDHPNARIGAWQPGDDILVQAVTPWAGEVSIWSRIIGSSLVGEHKVRLALQRADRFTYGAG
ncbi:hypothetical protein ABZ671_18545 [Micromonospora sp. NPDC006766]|uniref:hypothetical protein n=1 Tax=Micromonospora sp. NPDC006766 TaxID=3154778 RepID=UPI00340F555B